MSIMMSEEFITLAGSNDYKIFTKKFQRKERNLYSVNLIIIHGGPGINTHKELVDVFVPSIFEKTDVGSVLFYDQLGCGSSDKPNDTSQYSISAFVHHLSLIINGMSQVVLFGYSFGGQLVMEWLCTAFTSNVVGVIISNSPLDQVTYGLKQEKLRMELDLDLQTFYDQEENIKIEDGSIESLVYATLIGKGESRITGSMKNWNVKARISMLEIVSALFLSGDFDTIPFEEYEILRSFATVKIISGAGHAPFYETPGEFWGAVSQFLDRIIQK